MTTAPISDKTERAAIPSSATSSTGRSIFEDPAIGEAAKNDAFVRFISLNWRSILLALVTIGASMVGYNIFTTTALEKRARATTILADVQENYKALIDKQSSLAKLKDSQQQASDDAAKKAATESVEKTSQEIGEARTKLSLMIESLDSTPPFSGYATLYRGLLAGRFGDYATVEAALAAAPSWEAIDDARSTRRFIAETIHLGLLKTLAQSDAHHVKAKEDLQTLGSNGEFAAVEALDVLSLLVTTPEERAELRKSVEAMRVKFPSQSKKLDQIEAGLQ